MKPEPFYEKLKSKLDELKENTLSSLIANDEEYHRLANQLDLAEQQYQALNLTLEQQSIIDHYIAMTDSCNMEYSTLSYLAGLIDAQKIGMLIPTGSTENTNTDESIRKFYYDILQPCSVQCETPDTIKFWKRYTQDEEDLLATLTLDQSAAFKKLSQMNLDGVGYSMADSFVYGFQLGTKILMALMN